MSEVSQVAPLGRAAVPVVIAIGTSLSPAFDLEGYELKAIQMPAAWTAAAITFQQAEKDGGTYQDVFDETGAEVSLTVAAGHTIVFSDTLAAKLAGRFYKIRSGVTATPVNQAAARTLNLIVRQGA